MAEPVRALDVKQMHAIFESLFNAGDLEGLTGLYEPDAVLNAARGTDAIREVLQGFLALGGRISIESKAVFEHPGGIALTHGEWSLNGGSEELSGKTAEVLRRQPDGRWLYIIDNPWV